MNRITRRTWLMSVFIFLLLGGMVFFLWEYATTAEDWVVFPGSPHIYSGSNLRQGVVTDRSGAVVLDLADGRTYASDSSTRRSMLHWVGDRKGNIRDVILEGYAGHITGYDLINGVYAPKEMQDPGQINLTISARVQNVALAALGGRKGTVGVYNYKTGEILCAVTAPNFDPDYPPDIAADKTGAFEGVYLNRFTQTTYPPGSIFKVVTTAAALDSVPDILDRTFTCTGTYEYGIDKVTCESAHGTVTLGSALSHSCNCAFAQIAELVGKENLTKYVDQFRVVEPITFDGITTAKGNFDIRKAAPVEVAWSGIGQYTDMINAASFLQFMGAVAGGGTGAEPYIVGSVYAGDELTYEAETRLCPRIMSPELAQTVQEFMAENVKNIYGTWNFPGFETVCGKSGTSELGGDKISNAMFAGFIMDEQYPLAFIVVAENSGYGSANCVPILSKVLAACKEVMDG